MGITRTFFLLIAIGAPLALAGCSAPSEPRGTDEAPPAETTEKTPEGAVAAAPAAASAPETGDTLVWRENAEPNMMHPHLDLTDGTGKFISAFIVETLLSVNEDTLEFEPNIAKAWEISEDHLTYTFHLRDDVTFSDGKPLTSADVKFTFDAIMDPAHDTPAVRSYLKDVTQCEVIDDYTIKFHVSKPYFGHELMLGGLEVIPKHIYGEGDYNKHPASRAPVGSGPYTFVSWDTGQQVTLARNENYWNKDEPVYLDKWIFRFISDDNAALQVLLRHDADVMDFQGEMWNRHTFKPEFTDQFHKVVQDSPVPGYLSRYNYIGWNMRKPQFEDKRVRRALCMLFDRQLIIDTVWGGLGTVITGPFYQLQPENNPDIAPWPFDPEGAAKLLDEAGWIDADRDGVREKDGVKLEFELSFASGVAEYEQLSTVYQEELKRVGVIMKPNPIEWATFQERLQKRTFDACMLAWLAGLAVDPYQLWHSSQAEAGSNYPGFVNAEVDEILEEARSEFDRDKRVEMYRRFHGILHEEQPYLFLYARPGLIAVDKRVHNVVVHKNGVDPTEWWVPKALQMYP